MFEDPPTFGPQPPNDPVLGAIWITFEREIVGFASWAEIALFFAAVDTVLSFSMLTRNAHLAFHSHRTRTSTGHL